MKTHTLLKISLVRKMSVQFVKFAIYFLGLSLEIFFAVKRDN